MSFLVWCVVTGMVELAAWIPSNGCSMNMFGWRYASRSLGFAMGWLYFYSLSILVPYEITAAGLVRNMNEHFDSLSKARTDTVLGHRLLECRCEHRSVDIDHDCSNCWIERTTRQVLWRD